MKSKLILLSVIISISSKLMAKEEDPCEFRSSNHIHQGYLLKHVEDVSRDFYYIQLKDSPDRLKICGIVGGEHITHYRILGFTNEHFQINTQSVDGIAYTSITGNGIQVVGDDTGTHTDVLVESDGVTWVDIKVSASFESFTSGYQITIIKD